MQNNKKQTHQNLRSVLHEVIFEADTPAGKLFDVLLIISILFSVLIVILDSVSAINSHFGGYFFVLEWFFTLLFTIEYLLRLVSVGKPLKYAISFYGIVDLFAVLPTYLSLIIPGTHYFIVIRILRVLRIFRIFKLAQYLGEADILWEALLASRRKIFIFLFTVLTLVIIIGSLMYVIEGHENGFTSIPKGIYWAIVTLTTVGYGDISPVTSIGQALAAIVMILGYGIIAVPTGIVTVEISGAMKRKISTRVCPDCSLEGHDRDAKFCKFCGTEL